MHKCFIFLALQISISETVWWNRDFPHTDPWTGHYPAMAMAWRKHGHRPAKTGFTVSIFFCSANIHTILRWNPPPYFQCCRLLASILLDVLHCSPRKKPIIHYQFEKQDHCQRPSSRHVNLNSWMCIAPGNVKLGDCRFLAQGMLLVFGGLLVSCVVGRLVLGRIVGWLFITWFTPQKSNIDTKHDGFPENVQYFLSNMASFCWVSSR